MSNNNHIISLHSANPKSPPLTEILDSYGSDKGSIHKYSDYYSIELIKVRTEVRNVLEIGIGSTDLTTPSNMSQNGNPGASLRAWEKYFPNASIFGADIDEKTLFEQSHTRTFLVDQTSQKSLNNLKNQLPRVIDIIFIDGLHTPIADLNSLYTFLECIPQNGHIFIEDIGHRALFIYRLLAFLIRKQFLVKIVRTNELSTLVHIKRIL